MSTDEHNQLTLRKIDMAWEMARATVDQKRGVPEWAYIGAMLGAFKSAYLRLSDSFAELEIEPKTISVSQDGHGSFDALQQLFEGDGVGLQMEAARFLEEMVDKFAQAATTLVIEMRRVNHEPPTLN